MPTSRSYHDYLIESLKDPQEAAAYLDAVLEDGDSDELRLALKNVAEAQISGLKNTETTSSTEMVQQILLQQPSFDLFILLKILDELGFKLSVELKANV